MNYENKEEGLIASCPKCKGKRKMGALECSLCLGLGIYKSPNIPKDAEVYQGCLIYQVT